MSGKFCINYDVLKHFSVIYDIGTPSSNSFEYWPALMAGCFQNYETFIKKINQSSIITYSKLSWCKIDLVHIKCDI